MAGISVVHRTNGHFSVAHLTRSGSEGPSRAADHAGSRSLRHQGAVLVPRSRSSRHQEMGCPSYARLRSPCHQLRCHDGLHANPKRPLQPGEARSRVKALARLHPCFPRAGRVHREPRGWRRFAEDRPFLEEPQGVSMVAVAPPAGAWIETLYLRMRFACLASLLLRERRKPAYMVYRVASSNPRRRGRRSGAL